MTDTSIFSYFSSLQDPRTHWRVLYPLEEILLLVLTGTLAGMEDFVEIQVWGEERLAFLRRFAPFERGIASHDTLNHVMNHLDADAFKACFTAWVSAIRSRDKEIIAVDGKTSRRTHDKGKGRAALHLVSAWACEQRLVLGQEACAEKSNEITAIPRLLERLELMGALVTIDAMGTQSAIAETIVTKGGDYLLSLRENWPVLCKDVGEFFDDPPTDMVSQPFETIDKGHGRLEIRRHTVCHNVDWLISDRRYPGEPRFPHLAMIAMVETHVERGDKIQTERRLYLSSAKLDTQTFAHAVRAHWGVENRLHWMLDVVFHDDLSRLRSGHGPQNMATVRHIALNMLKSKNDKHSIKVRTKRAAMSEHYLADILSQKVR